MNQKQLTLREFIEQIEKAGTKDRDGNNKTVCFDFGSAIPTYLSSWRGDYSQLQLGYELSGYDGVGKYEEATAEKLLKELKSAIGKTYEGWKGGYYTMNEDTPVWVSNSGNGSHTAIVGVLDDEFALILLTAFHEY